MVEEGRGSAAEVDLKGDVSMVGGEEGIGIGRLISHMVERILFSFVGGSFVYAGKGERGSVQFRSVRSCFQSGRATIFMLVLSPPLVNGGDCMLVLALGSQWWTGDSTKTQYVQLNKHKSRDPSTTTNGLLFHGRGMMVGRLRAGKEPLAHEHASFSG